MGWCVSEGVWMCVCGGAGPKARHDFYTPCAPARMAPCPLACAQHCVDHHLTPMHYASTPYAYLPPHVSLILRPPSLFRSVFCSYAPPGEREVVVCMDTPTASSALGLALSSELERRKKAGWAVLPLLPLSGRWLGCSCFTFKRRKLCEADQHELQTVRWKIPQGAGGANTEHLLGVGCG